MDISNRIKKMADPSGKGFDELFNKEVNKHPTKKDAFKAMNQEFMRAIGTYRYRNYESYRITRRERLERQFYEW